MSKNISLTGSIIAVVIILIAIMGTILLRSYDATSPDLGSGILPVQTNGYAVAVLGDSLTVGVGASSADTGLGPQVLSAVQAKHPDATLHIFGQSGATTNDVVSDQLPRLAALGNAPLVILVVGTNDIVQGVTTSTFESNYATIISKITAPGRTVAVLNIPNFSQTPAVPTALKAAANAVTQQLNAFIGQTVTGITEVRAVDFYALSSQKLQPGSNLLSSDGFHPNDAGYKIIATAINSAINP